MISPSVFFKGLGLMLLLLSFIWVIFFWIKRLFGRIFGVGWKYRFLGKKFKEEDVERLLEYSDRGMSSEDVEKYLLLNGIEQKRTKELIYIYNRLLKIKSIERRTK